MLLHCAKLRTPVVMFSLSPDWSRNSLGLARSLSQLLFTISPAFKPTSLAWRWCFASSVAQRRMGVRATSFLASGPNGDGARLSKSITNLFSEKESNEWQRHQ